MFKIDRLHRDGLLTFFTSGMSILATFVLYKLSGHFFKHIGFAEYSMGKRIISFFIPALALGMVTGLPREVARVNRTELDREKFLYLRYAFLIESVIVVLMLVLFLVFKISLSSLFFASSAMSYMVFPIGLTIAGIVYTELAFSYFRGLAAYKVSNVIFLINLTVLPLIIILLVNSISFFFWIYGLAMMLISFLFVSKHLLSKSSQKFCKIHFTLFVTYSARRVVGDIVYQLIFLIPAILAAHLFGVLKAGDIAFSMALLNLISLPLTPVSMIMLPEAMKKLRQGKLASLKLTCIKLTKYAVILGSAVTICLIFGAPLIVNLMLGGRGDSLHLIRILSFSCVPFAIYFTLRSTIDAVSRRAFNAINLIISFLVFIIFVAISLDYAGSIINYIAYAVVLAIYTLGLLTALRLFILLKSKVDGEVIVL